MRMMASPTNNFYVQNNQLRTRPQTAQTPQICSVRRLAEIVSNKSHMTENKHHKNSSLKFESNQILPVGNKIKIKSFGKMTRKISIDRFKNSKEKDGEILVEKYFDRKKEKHETNLFYLNSQKSQKENGFIPYALQNIFLSVSSFNELKKKTKYLPKSKVSNFKLKQNEPNADYETIESWKNFEDESMDFSEFERKQEKY